MKKLIVILIAVIGMAFLLYMAEMLGMSKMGIVLVMGLMFGALVVGLLWTLLTGSGDSDIIVKIKKEEDD